jgi:tetratricopeptide (TPR) repeat protein
MEQSLIERARCLMRRGDIGEADSIVRDELRRIGDGVNGTEVWRLRFIRAQVMEARGQVEEALSYLESFEPPDTADTESTAKLRMYRASYSGYLGRHGISHRLFSEAEKMARDADLIELLGDVHLSEAFIFFRQKDYVSSGALFQSAFDLSEKAGGWYLRGYGLWGIGKNLMIQEHHSEALPWLEESLKIFEGVAARLAVAMVWSELAVCYLGLGEDQKALDLLHAAERTNLECGVVHNYQVVLANIGNVYLHRRDYFTAISYYQRALTLAREIKDPVSIKKWTRNTNLAYARIRLAVDQTNPRMANSTGHNDRV